MTYDSSANRIGCHDQGLDDEIRSRLDKLNALSDLINSLERQFDEANTVFRETLKCSTDRLSTIAKTLGSKSIRHGRIYHAAKLRVEQSQSDCQKACVQFEQANNDHQSAKEAIKKAELRLREISGQAFVESNTAKILPENSVELLEFSKLELNEGSSQTKNNCDITSPESSCMGDPQSNSLNIAPSTSKVTTNCASTAEGMAVDSKVGSSTITIAQNKNKIASIDEIDEDHETAPREVIRGTAKISEELNQAILKLIEAEAKRSQSERQHLDQTNKLMLAQDHLMRLEREHGQLIRRSQTYFDEAKHFDAKLNSVKGDICRISDEILTAKQAYAQTLSELEQFSEDLHVKSSTQINGGSDARESS